MRLSLPNVLAAFFICVLPLIVVSQKADTGPSLSADKWREDLRYFAAELAKRHKNVFHAVSRERFEGAVAKLDTDIPTLQAHQITVRLMQIAAMVGDGHTGVNIPTYFGLYPISVYWFGSELRVIAAAREYEKALGTRVVKIGDLGIDDAEVRIKRCFPSSENENEWYVMGTSTAFTVRAEILNALGIIPDVSHASFTFEDDAGKRFTLDLQPIPAPIAGASIGMLPAASAQPLYRQRPTEKFWFVNLPDSGTIYVNFRSYESLGENSRKLFKLIDETHPKRLVIDLRQNGGGDFFEGRKHIIDPIKERSEINKKGHLFVLVGRRTFSAAMANATDFRKETNAILVGEPIGERPNSYSENDLMTLPNSRLVVSYSTKYYKFLDEDVPAVLPDQRIDPTWPSFKAGRDPVMDWVLSTTP